MKIRNSIFTSGTGDPPVLNSSAASAASERRRPDGMRLKRGTTTLNNPRSFSDPSLPPSFQSSRSCAHRCLVERTHTTCSTECG